MKKIIPILILILLTNCSGIFKSKPEYLFVQDAKSGSFDGKVLRLDGISKNVIIFSDRPYRISGHLTNDKFLGLWNDVKNNDSFKKDPPNAAISYYDNNKMPATAIIELSNLRIKNNSVFYDVKILEGKLSKNFSEVSLFIDYWLADGNEVHSFYYKPKGI